MRQRPLTFLITLLFCPTADTFAETVVVNVATDTLHLDCATNGLGVCSLRDAILFTNSHPGMDRIEFDPSLSTVSVATELPAILEAVEIDGDRGTGSRLTLDFSQDMASGGGLLIAGDGSTVDGLEIVGCSMNPAAIRVTGDGNVIGREGPALGNRIACVGGIEIDGGSGNLVQNAVIESVFPAIYVHGGASFNVVGGSPLCAVDSGTSAAVVVGDGAADASTGNSIVFDHFLTSGTPPFELGSDGYTANDPADADAGPNSFQNSPVLTSATSAPGFLVVGGVLNSTPASSFTLHFYAGDLHPGGLEVALVGSRTVTTDGSGDAHFAAPIVADFAAGQWVAATATAETDGSTSELGLRQLTAEPVGASFFTVTPCRIADTRNDTPLVANQFRDFTLAGLCGLPEGVRAVSLNLTVIAPTGAGYVTMFPAGGGGANTAAITFAAGQTRSNNMTLSLLSVEPGLARARYGSQPGATAHFAIDVNGYYL